MITRIFEAHALGCWLSLALVSFVTPAPANAAACRWLEYDFEPDCLRRDAAGLCHFDLAHPDLGPQIAVWVESADGTQFIDTVMVTNAVALYGIGNRPGVWNFRSGPRYPYGRRPMALPVWSHHRGILYDSVVMPDGRDDEIASHQEVSSPEPYFCRPMMSSEVVDAITCASGNFRSAKGIFDPTAARSYYPPRGDLTNWGDVCVPEISIEGAGCSDGDARQFGLIDDLDAVATATPPYDQSFVGTWSLPDDLPAGDYALMVEVSKEFDTNASFSAPSFLTPYELTYYGSYGLDGNLGQPSAVFRVPFHAGAESISSASADDPIGYGDWTGSSGDVTPLDARLSRDPGSGIGRLRRVDDGSGSAARLRVRPIACPSTLCDPSRRPPDAPRMAAPVDAQDPAGAAFEFRQSADGGSPVLGYEVRYQPENQSTIDETTFERWAPAPPPAVAPPGTTTTVTLLGLRPSSGYAIAMRARGACGWSEPSFIRLYVGAPRYKQLSGCVIATAAYGTDLHPDVRVLRRERDWLSAHSALARLGALLYAESAPPLASMLGRSELARTVARALLRPFAAANRDAIRQLGGGASIASPP